MSNNRFQSRRAWAGDRRAIAQITLRRPAIAASQECQVCRNRYDVEEFEPESLCPICREARAAEGAACLAERDVPLASCAKTRYTLT